MVLKAAHDVGADPAGADLYMYGHWWACEPCWKVLIDAGVRDVYLVENAHEVFARDKVYAEQLQPSVKSVYISGGLTNLPEAERDSKKKFYEELAQASEEVGCRAYIPHLHSDPMRHPELSARVVFDHDTGRVDEYDVTVAEVTHPSLGTGGEIVAAHQLGKPIVLVSKKGASVSRFALGNPSVVYHIEYEDTVKACHQLKNVLKQL